MMRFRCAFVNPPEPMNFEAISQFFPVILAPGVVALARGRWPGVHRAVDGLIVWAAVIGAAVVWAVLLGIAFGLLVAPQPGPELRARLQAKLADRSGALPAEQEYNSI